MAYNPFEKPIGSHLTVQDLERLIEQRTPEGYYVEYKEAFPSDTQIGESIASFANTYGGWYLIGMAVSEDHMASAISGFSIEEHPDSIVKIKELVKYNLDPAPVFFPQLIELKNGRGVLVIYIPDEQETPFIYRDGRIYRRTYESSNPVPEINRYTIDRLVDSGREVARRFEKFCQEDQSIGQSDSESGWVKLFLAPYPLGTISRYDMLNQQGIDQLLQLSKSQIPVPFGESVILISGNLPFNFGRPTPQSVILRQIDPSNFNTNSLSAEFFTNGQAKFMIPLNYFPSLKNWDYEEYQSKQVKQTLEKLLEAERIVPSLYMRFFDIGHLWLTIACILCYYQEWLGSEPLLAELQFGVTIEGVWRSVPFFDSDEWGLYVQKYGLPVVGDELIRVPRDFSRGGIRVGLGNDWPLWLEICYYLSLAFGLPPELYSNTLLEAISRSARP
jgi:hypothetical protein